MAAKGILGVFVITWLCIIGFVIVPSVLHRNSVYAGQVSFQTIEDFEAFKNDITIGVDTGELVIKDITIIFPELPVIIDYHIEASWDYDFLYSEDESHQWDWVSICLLAVTIGMLLVMIGFALSSFLEKEEEDSVIIW